MGNRMLTLALAAGAAVAWVAPLHAEETVTSRDPFWPVGYEASGAGKSSGGANGGGEKEAQPLLDLSRLSPEEQAIIKSHMRVNGILEQRNSRIALINNDVVREGDKITIAVRGQSYNFLIRSLQPQNIVLEPIRIEQNVETQKEEVGS